MNNYKILGLISFFAVSLFCSALQAAEYYQYKGADGVLYFTDNLNDIPEAQRQKLIHHKKIETTAPASLPQNTQVIQEQKTNTNETGNDNKVLTPAERKNQIQALNDEKKELETMHTTLMGRVQQLESERTKAKTAEQAALYKQKVSELNNEISAYEERRIEFDTKRKQLETETSQ